MQKELDLTTVKMANQQYNIERIRRKSIQDNNIKKQQVYGELYRSKKITKKKLHTICVLAASATVFLASHKGLTYFETVDTYNRTLNNTVRDELSYSESIDFLENYDVPKEHYDNYIEALESLDDTEYDFFGNRKDGTTNDAIPSDPDSIINLSDKSKDAIVNAVDNEIKEYKGAK